MNILAEDFGDKVALFFDLKEGQALRDALEAAMPMLNKKSKAYKIAKRLSDEMPVG